MIRCRSKARAVVGFSDETIVKYGCELREIDRRQYIRIAKELGYEQEVEDKIRHARTEPEVTRILADARHEASYREQEEYSE